MRIMYMKPELNDLSQGSRIAFARQFRFMSQDEVSDKLGLTGECKRRTMTRYERGNRNPKDKRLMEIANILNINVNSIREYDFRKPIDLFYILMWMEEIIPKYQIDLSKIPNKKEVYYGNTASDAAAIGFRDDKIYEFIKGNNKMIDLKQIDRDKTIEAFKNYKGDIY